MTAKLTADRALQAQLDRLAANELSDHERGSLLAWLDEDAGRWRACALAFLEAQSWETAAADWPHAVATQTVPGTASVQPDRSPGTTKRASDWLSAVGLAAAALFMFGAGHLSAFSWRAVSQPAEGAASARAGSDGPLLASVAVRTNLSPGVAARLQIPVTPVAADAPPPKAISDYERKQWEKRGFEVQEERRYLPAQLPDGTPVLLPVNKLHVKLRGTPVS